MEIRSAKAEDVPAVLPMVDRIGKLHQGWDRAKYSFRDEPAKLYRNWLTARADDPRSVFLVADRQGQLVGFLVATVETELPIYAVREFGFIHDLWVEENYRHEGIARQMVMLAVERFTELRVPQIRCDTATANDSARQLFASCGFRPSTTEMLIELKP